MSFNEHSNIELAPHHHKGDRSLCGNLRPRRSPSQSVTSSGRFWVQMLQIETNRRHPNRKSKSVTPGPFLAFKMLQVETNREPPQRCLSPLWRFSTKRSRPDNRGGIKQVYLLASLKTQRERRSSPGHTFPSGDPREARERAGKGRPRADNEMRYSAAALNLL